MMAAELLLVAAVPLKKIKWQGLGLNVKWKIISLDLYKG